MKGKDTNVRLRYLHQEILSAPREKLLLLTYEIAIGACNKAIAAIEESNAERANAELQTAQRAIRELQFALRPEKAEELSHGLNQLYDFMHNELVIANLKKDTGKIEKVMFMLGELFESWQKALDGLLKEGTLSTEEEERFATPELVGGGLNISC